MKPASTTSGGSVPTRSRAQLAKAFAALGLLGIWLGCTAGLRVLTSPEEARYVSAALAMVQTGDWLTPTLNGLPFLDKPPLFYWIEAAALRIPGALEWTSRIAPWLGALIGAGCLGWFVRRFQGAAIARWSLLVLATMPLFYAGAQFANTDMLLSGLICATTIAGASAVSAHEAGAPHRVLSTFAWFAAALAVLAKGLVGIVLPALVLAIWSVVRGRKRSLRALLSPWGVALFLVVASPWYLVQEHLHPGFARYFFVNQHLERYLGGGFNSEQPWWFYGVVVPSFTLPWCIWMLCFLRVGGIRFAVRQVAPIEMLMWVWLTVTIVFFSIPRSKPIAYAMPALFPIAQLIASRVVLARKRWPAIVTLAVAALGSLGYVAFSGLTYEADHRTVARTLGLLRAEGDPVVFAGDYYYDVALYGAVKQARVVGDWSNPAFAKDDDWGRELRAAAAFAPRAAAAVLLDAQRVERLCGRPLWVLSPTGAEATWPELAAGTVILDVRGTSLRRLPATSCKSDERSGPADAPVAATSAAAPRRANEPGPALRR
jgi:4-amino-4-deoxy-L-arabinose transferase-like glycosyltransferase